MRNNKLMLTFNVREAVLPLEDASSYDFFDNKATIDNAQFVYGHESRPNYYRLKEGPISCGALANSLIALTGERPLLRSRGKEDGGISELVAKYGPLVDEYLSSVAPIISASKEAVIELSSALVEFITHQVTDPNGKTKSAPLSWHMAERSSGKEFVDAVRAIYNKQKTMNEAFQEMTSDHISGDKDGRIEMLRAAENNWKSETAKNGQRFEAWGLAGKEAKAFSLSRDMSKLRLGESLRNDNKRLNVQPSQRPCNALIWSGKIHVPVNEEDAKRLVRAINQGPGYANILDGGMITLESVRIDDIPYWNSPSGVSPVSNVSAKAFKDREPKEGTPK